MSMQPFPIAAKSFVIDHRGRTGPNSPKEPPSAGNGKNMIDETLRRVSALEPELNHRPSDAKVLLAIGAAMLAGAAALAFFFNLLRTDLREGIANVNEHFKAVNERFAKMDSKLESRFESIDNRLHSMDTDAKVLSTKVENMQQDIMAIKTATVPRR